MLDKWRDGKFDPCYYHWRIVEYIGLVNRYWGVYLVDPDKRSIGHFMVKTKIDGENLCREFDVPFFYGWGEL